MSNLVAGGVVLPDPQVVLQMADVYRQMGFVPLATYVPLGWTEAGVPVCSCYQGEGCGAQAGKHPIGKYGDISTPDAGYSQVWHALQAETAKGLSANLCIRSGPMSGVFVVDLDVKEGQDGVAQFDRWLSLRGLDRSQLQTLTARSGGGGVHYVFRHPPGVELQASNSSEIFGKGVDIKTNGSPFHVYPSRHKYGGEYTWTSWTTPTPAPEKIWRAAQKTITAHASSGGVDTPSLDRVKDFAEKLAGSRDSIDKKTTGKHLKALLAGEAILTEDGSGGYEAFLRITNRLGHKWPQADTDKLCAYLHDGVQARINVRSTARVTHAVVRDMLQSAQAKAMEVRSSWQGKLSVTEDGEPKATTNNIALFLRHRPEWAGVLAFNERANDIVFMKRPPFDDFSGPTDAVFPRRVKDVDYTRIEMWLERNTKIVGARSDLIMRGCEAAAREQTFEPFRDYLKSLPAWDNTHRAFKWLTLYGGAIDKQIVHEMGFRWLLACVHRTFYPGGKVDNVLILEGPQGAMKSSLLEALLPNNELFLDDLPAPTTKDAKLLLHGPVIVEIAELAAFKRADNEHMKSFLTTKVDKLRPPYGRSTEQMPRRCVFAGTTNDDQYLKDPSGNRRYWPVVITRANPAALAAVRDQLWAEVLAAFTQGYKHYFESGELEKMAEHEQAERLESDPWEDSIRSYLFWREQVLKLLFAAQSNPTLLNQAQTLIDARNPAPLFAGINSAAPKPNAEEALKAFMRLPRHKNGSTQMEIYTEALHIVEAERRTKITDRRIREVMTRLGYRMQSAHLEGQTYKIWMRRVTVPGVLEHGDATVMCG